VLAVVDGARRDLLLEQAERATRRAEADVEKAKAAGGRAEAQEAAARAGLEEQRGMLARREAARAKAPGLVPEEEIATVRASVSKWQAQVDEAVAAEKEAAAGVRVLETALEEAKGRESIARRDAADARVHPPLAGVAQARHVVVGQWVRAGAPVATLVDARRLRHRFRVPEAESTALVPGRSEVTFRVASLPGKEPAADLVYVQGSADPVTRMVECLAEVREPDPALKPGFFASVTVLVKRQEAAVVVPEESVLATERGLVVYVLSGGKAKESRVRLGLRTKDGWVEVVGGLDAGASVAVENAYVLADGLAVDPFPSAKAGKPSPATAPPPPPAPAGPASEGGPR
jgi:RND family efflux transporter MFP subunit